MKSLVKLLIALLMLLDSCLPAQAANDASPGAGAGGTWVLDDFEDGDLKGATGLSWFALADDVAGGGSQARLEAVRGGAEGSRHAMRLSGELRAGRGQPFAGAWLSLDRAGRAVDLTPFEGVRLRVKGPARLQVGLRNAVTNFMAEVEAGPGWQQVQIPFSTLAPQGQVPEGARWTPESVQVFGVTTPQLARPGAPVTGPVEFQVDDVVLYGRGTGRTQPAAAGTNTAVAVITLPPLSSVPSSGWTLLTEDPERDGTGQMFPDAIRVEAIPTGADGMLWVRVSLREPPNDRWMGMNLVLDVDGDASNGMAWWGANKEFKFDRLVSVWCFHVAGGCQG